MTHDPIIITSYARTPIGGFMGDLSSIRAVDLGAAAIKAAVARSGIAAEKIDRVYMGCVLPAALGQAPARQAALAADLPHSVEATTVNKMCGSGMQSAIMAFEALSAGTADVIVAGGMESMSNAPYALPRHRAGARLGHDRVVDTMMMDGLEDAYSPGKAMGVFAEDAASSYGLTREQQDDYAILSLNRAKAAIASGAFAGEIVPVIVSLRSGDTVIDTDEQPGKARVEKISSLRPVFSKDGTITAANSSSISDGAAALVLTRASVATALGLPHVAHIVGTAAHAHAPQGFATAPAFAVRKLLNNIGWTMADVDLFEINEAFGAVALIAARDLDMPLAKLNVNGGATALGHPIGASGARIVTTLLAALRARGLRRGIASLCLGGGEATAMAFELSDACP